MARYVRVSAMLSNVVQCCQTPRCCENMKNKNNSVSGKGKGEYTSITFCSFKAKLHLLPYFVKFVPTPILLLY